MPTPTDHSKHLLSRISHELDKLPITSEQKAKVVSQLLKYACFMDTDGGTKKSGNFRVDSEAFEFQRKIETLAESFSDQGLTGASYLRAAIKHPSLFMQSPATLAANITGLVEHFAADGLTVKDYLRAALKDPPLFCQSPNTIQANIRGVARRLEAEGMTVTAYLGAALTHPSLFHYPPRTIVANIRAVAKKLFQNWLDC